MARQNASRKTTTGLSYLAICLALAMSGCSAGGIPEGARELPRGADGLQRYELAKLPPNTPGIVKALKNSAWKLEMGLTDGWNVFGENSNKDAPAKILIKRPRDNKPGEQKSKVEHELLVHCWNGISDIRQLREKTIATIEGAPDLKPLSEQTGPIRNVILHDEKPAPHGPVWVLPGGGAPAEVHTLYAYHDAGFLTFNAQGENTGKFATRYHRTIYVIVKPSVSAGGCNYGITLREYADGASFQQKFAGDALAIAASLK